MSALKSAPLEGGYGLQSAADAAPTLMKVVRRCLNSLSDHHVDGDGVSRRVRSPRLHQAVKRFPNKRPLLGPLPP
jgi:hypothetical protein